MPKCMIDGKEVEFQQGENLVEVAKKVGVEIPVFCYHPGLSVVAQCRMCAIEIEKMPKLQTACSTEAKEGMVVHTQSEKVTKNRASVMEFLLINHPLDCPICDQSGECDLQDFSFEHGDAYQRTTEERRTFLDLDMGPVIKKNMNRCIHCTRCIRFGDEIAGVREMVALQRGNDTEITTIDGRPLETDYAANYADICPVGSLTLKDFRFKKRVWFLKKTPTVCEGCSKGCNMEIHWDANVIQRCIPRENMEINKYWLCDEGRFNYRYTMSENRITEPSAGEWGRAIDSAKSALKGKSVAALIGTDLTVEEAKLLKEQLSKLLPGAKTFHFGTPGIRTSKDDAPADKILKRKSKTSNLNGIEKLGFEPFERLPSGTQAVVVFRGGRAVLPELKGVDVVGVGVFQKSEAAGFKAVLPGASFAEKDGTIVNYEGVEQKIRRAVIPPGQSKQLSEILMIWANRKAEAGVA